MVNKHVVNIIMVTAGLLTGAFFSYLLQFFLGITLTVEDYGIFTTLLALTAIIGVPFSVLTTSIIKVVSEYDAKEDTHTLAVFFWNLLKMTLALGIVTVILISLSSSYFITQLKITDTTLIVLFGCSLGLSYASIGSFAYLQGLQKFRAFTFTTILSSFMRFGLASIFVILGLQLRGAFLGINSALMFSCLLGIFLLRKNVFGFNNQHISLREIYSKILILSGPILIINLGLMALNNIDMIIVKKYFDGTLAGYYAGTMTLGKILLFGAGSVTTVMFPRISALYSAKKDYRPQFLKFLLIQFIIVFGGVGVFTLFPRLITLSFFGHKFDNSVQYLPGYAVFIGLYIMVNFLVMGFLAMGKLKIAVLLLVFPLIQIFLLSKFHTSLAQVIWMNTLVVIGLFLMLSAYLVKETSSANKS